jgi:hypothetical protein
VRIEENGKTPVAFRHGEVLKRVPGGHFERRFRLRRLFFLLLRRVRVAASPSK